MSRPRRQEDGFNIDALLHPENAFGGPMDVVNDADLTLNEKRAILASWASDVCGAATAPASHRPPEQQPIQFEKLTDALKELDRMSLGKPRQNYRRVLERRTPGVFGRKDDGPPGDRGPRLS